jgi:hypothetical protein
MHMLIRVGREITDWLTSLEAILGYDAAEAEKSEG